MASSSGPRTAFRPVQAPLQQAASDDSLAPLQPNWGVHTSQAPAAVYPAGQSLVSPREEPRKKKKKKAKKRLASEPSPSSPSAGKRKKTGKKDGAKKAKTGASQATPSEAQIFTFMSALAGKYGWEFNTPQTRTAAPGVRPSAAAPSPSPNPPPNRAPAALGAPPGEETFPVYPPAPPVLRPSGPGVLQPPAQPASRPSVPGALRGDAAAPLREPTPLSAHADGFESPISVSDTDRSSWPESSAPDTWSTVSGAPSLASAEVLPGLRHLGEEAEALLLRYMGEFYAPPLEPAEPLASASRLFKSGTGPSPGIALTPDFKQEYERIAKEPAARSGDTGFKRAFLFQPGDMDKFLCPESLSPDLLALGDYVASPNPLRQQPFTKEDRRWTHMASLARVSMRLAAYAGALSNLAAQASDLQVSAEDRVLLDSLLLSIAELQWKQATRAAFFTTRHRRDLALQALGFHERQRAQLVQGMPYEGPFLFSGVFAPRIKDELARCQQARELAGQLRRAQTPQYRPRGSPRRRQTAVTRRVTVTMPPPQTVTQPRQDRRGRGRGRQGRGGSRGKRRPSAKGRGGF